jgi:predicted dehydrogenase
VRNGAIGKISHVECSFGGPGVPCDLAEEPMEPGLDWERWVGPGPMRPYNSVLSPRGKHEHFPMWRLYKEYGGGMVCDWGAHHLDIAQWGLGMDESGPVKVEVPADPKAVEGGILTYKNGIQVIHKNGFGAHFFGNEGEVRVNRGKLEFWRDGKQIAAGASTEGTVVHVQKEYLANAKIKLYESRDHIADFLNCVQSRKKPITNEIVGGRSAICCHLLNQAYYNQTTILWKPKRMTFARNGGKAEWLTREYRNPWTV